jgi:hydrogenase expression/formation protein HypD
MKYLEEYRDSTLVRQLAQRIRRVTTRPWTLMEICGGQTHAILRFGLNELLPSSITLVHGPGCPVCVTPLEMIEQALQIAARTDVIFTSFGDMLRVPGKHSDLLRIKSEGGDIRVVYSPLDAVKIAGQNPDRHIVFFAVGFETTAPATALAVLEANRRGLSNFSLLVSHVRVPPAIELLLSAPDCRIHAFLAAGHVCAVMGCEEYLPLVTRHRVPIVVTGFEPVDILHGILMAVGQLESGRAELENQYIRCVETAGNPAARALIHDVFEIVPRQWRGLGNIPRSGLGIREAYAGFDAEKRFGLSRQIVAEPAECLSGKVLLGLKKPNQCPAFGTRCTPDHPLGAPMVSGEGACAAYHRYRLQEPTAASNLP